VQKQHAVGADKRGTKYSGAYFGPPGSKVGYGDVDAELLRDCVELVSREGDCIMFSRTSQGEAAHVRILSGGLVEKWYPDSAEALQEVLQGIVRALKDG
jgi:hypothetical protein